MSPTPDAVAPVIYRLWPPTGGRRGAARVVDGTPACEVGERSAPMPVDLNAVETLGVGHERRQLVERLAPTILTGPMLADGTTLVGVVAIPRGPGPTPGAAGRR